MLIKNKLLWELSFPNKAMTQSEFNTEITVNVRFNALEKSILQELGYSLEDLNKNAWNLEDIQNLKQELYCDQMTNIPERFYKKDHTGKVPIDQLLKNIRNIESNMQRQKEIVDNVVFQQ